MESPNISIISAPISCNSRIPLSKDDILRVYHEECCRLLKELKKVTIEHVPKLYNGDANRLAQHASGYWPMESVMALELPADDWRKESGLFRRSLQESEPKNQISSN